ncbi:hypothetical protein PVA45_00270 [Entomospira entomophila]|uniref:Uncharacterized protein n=1 Tax=Entomospira entomophila TaxID=2719988 RepID=A0A968KQR1_9SPIO|nr:hypothetical protein [Entomospira entomophilus]NIZ39958.1 hypothetical protein [Entomospira entomophilus]WDI35519.1 hypothetical protein PVA45_00270 [Entomospira entomophilus]
MSNAQESQLNREDALNLHIFFTKEVIQTLGVESEAILRYDVYDFPVQLYHLHGHIASIIMEGGEFFQKTVAQHTEDSTVSLKIRSNGKSAFKNHDIVFLSGTLKKVERHAIQGVIDDEQRVWAEVSFVLDNESWQQVARAITPMVEVMHSYAHGGLRDEFLLREHDIATKNLTLRFSSVSHPMSEQVRILPERFTDNTIVFFMNEQPAIDIGENLLIQMVILEHQVSVQIRTNVINIERIFDGVIKVRAKFLERPHLAYLVFLGELGRESA